MGKKKPSCLSSSQNRSGVRGWSWVPSLAQTITHSRARPIGSLEAVWQSCMLTAGGARVFIRRSGAGNRGGRQAIRAPVRPATPPGQSWSPPARRSGARSTGSATRREPTPRSWGCRALAVAFGGRASGRRLETAVDLGHRQSGHVEQFESAPCSSDPPQLPGRNAEMACKYPEQGLVRLASRRRSPTGDRPTLPPAVPGDPVLSTSRPGDDLQRRQRGPNLLR